LIDVTPSAATTRTRSMPTESLNSSPKMVTQRNGAATNMTSPKRAVIRIAARKTRAASLVACSRAARTRSGRCTAASAVGRYQSASAHATATL
jgi:hypothetical protein